MESAFSVHYDCKWMCFFTKAVSLSKRTCYVAVLWSASIMWGYGVGGKRAGGSLLLQIYQPFIFYECFLKNIWSSIRSSHMLLPNHYWQEMPVYAGTTACILLEVWDFFFEICYREITLLVKIICAWEVGLCILVCMNILMALGGCIMTSYC